MSAKTATPRRFFCRRIFLGTIFAAPLKEVLICCPHNVPWVKVLFPQHNLGENTQPMKDRSLRLWTLHRK